MLRKKMMRDIGKNLSSFITIFIMTFLGVFVFSGIHAYMDGMDYSGQRYYEENNLHGLLIEQIKDYELCIEELERFLPHIDNWATCDLLAVRTVKNHLNSYIKKIDRWLESEHIYTIRFGINMLMRYYLEEEFKLEYPRKVAAIRSEEYYVNMARAWYFATALAKKYDQVLPFLEEQKMDVWTHNKTIQKTIESYRITPEQKEYLRTLKIRQ